jgi:hypothetical protein
MVFTPFTQAQYSPTLALHGVLAVQLRFEIFGPFLFGFITTLVLFRVWSCFPRLKYTQGPTRTCSLGPQVLSPILKLNLFSLTLAISRKTLLPTRISQVYLLASICSFTRPIKEI